MILKPVNQNGIKFARFNIGLEDYRNNGEDYRLRTDS